MAGDVTFLRTPALDTISVRSGTAIVNWSVTDDGGTGTVDFLPAGLAALFRNDPAATADFVILNRILPTDAGRAVAFNGTVRSRLTDAGGATATGGTVWFYSPGGVIAGTGSVFDVGSLLLTANAVDPGAGGLFQPDGSVRLTGASGSRSQVRVDSGATLTAAAPGGYVVLAGPRVTQHGVVQATGTAALVAAEAAGFDVADGRADVRLIAGSQVAGGDTVIDQSGGRTTGTRHALLVAGTRGGAARIDATGASLASGGTIAIAAGRDIAGGAIDGTTAPLGADDLILTGGGYDGAVAVAASDALTLGDLNAATIALSGASVTGGMLTAAGVIAATSATGAVRLGDVSGGGVTLTAATDLAFGTLASTGDLSLAAGGAIATARDIANGGAFSASSGGALRLAAVGATGIRLRGTDIAAGALTATGAIDVVASGDLRGTTFLAGGDATLRAAGATLGAVTAGGALDIATTGALTLDTGHGRAIAVAGGQVGISRLIAGTGTLGVRATTAALGTIAADGAIDVATTGALAVADATSRTGIALTSTGGTIEVGNATTLLTVQRPLAFPAIPPADGGIALTAPGDITTTGNVGARGILRVDSGGRARFLGTATGAALDIGSADTEIGADAVIGSGAGTSQVRFTILPGIRGFVGGTGAGAPAGSYVLTGAELNRVRTAALIVSGGQVGGDPARAPDITVDTLALSRADAAGVGNFFGPATLFRVETPGTLRIAGQLGFTNLTAPDRVEFIAGDLIEAIAPAAGIALTGPAGAPAGTLYLQADRIVVATEAAAREVQLLATVDDRSRRLGRNDGAVSPAGYLSADALSFRVGRVLYIQNSGGTTTDTRAGFTAGAGGLTITTLGQTSPEVIINGRATDAAGNPLIVGRGLVPTVVPFAAGSTANGCAGGLALCTDLGDALGVSEAVFASTTSDTIDGQVDEEEREKASFRPRVPALIEVRGITAPSAPPVIDAPVTGAGNDDLWIAAPPAGGGK